MAPFADSQRAAVLISNALRATDMSLGRANTFIASQQDVATANPLASTAVPDAYTTGTLPEPKFASVNLVIRGDNVGALQAARATYVAATDNNSLTTAGANLARALRDVDGNLVRANAFITAQKSGQPFTIAELQ